MNPTHSKFDALIAEAQRAQFSGWDFSYLDGRWHEESPPWDYRAIVIDRLRQAHTMLDMGTGGGEFLATLPDLPRRAAATEAYEPNIPIARARLEPLGVHVIGFQDDDRLPFTTETFDLIINRHESYAPDELCRILKTGGRFITQQVGGRDNLDLNEALGAPAESEYAHWTLDFEAEELQQAGLRVLGRREAYPRTVFHDIGAVVYYLRAIPWQIPGFSTDHYLDRLLALHKRIEVDGPLVTHSHRFFIECVKD